MTIAELKNHVYADAPGLDTNQRDYIARSIWFELDDQIELGIPLTFKASPEARAILEAFEGFSDPQKRKAARLFVHPEGKSAADVFGAEGNNEPIAETKSTIDTESDTEFAQRLLRNRITDTQRKIVLALGMLLTSTTKTSFGTSDVSKVLRDARIDVTRLTSDLKQMAIRKSERWIERDGDALKFHLTKLGEEFYYEILDLRS